MEPVQNIARGYASGRPNVLYSALPFPWQYDPAYGHLPHLSSDDSPEEIMQRAKAVVEKAAKTIADSVHYPRVPPNWTANPDVLMARQERLVSELGMEREKARWLVESVAHLRVLQDCEVFVDRLLDHRSKKCLQNVAHYSTDVVDLLALDPSIDSAMGRPYGIREIEFVVKVGKDLLGEETNFAGSWNELLQSDGALEIRELLAQAIQSRAEVTRAFFVVRGWRAAVRAEDIISTVPERPTGVTITGR